MYPEVVEDSSYDRLCRRLGRKHPYNARSIEKLEWYDQPIVAIMRTQGDSRPRLDLLIDQSSTGDGDERVYTALHHQLVFDRMTTLNATMQNGSIPTIESYRLAEEIVRYRTQTTNTRHPRPHHRIETQVLTWQELPDGEMWTAPGKGPDGLAAPTGTRRRGSR